MNGEETPGVPENIEWLEPWEPVNDSGEALVREFRRELSDQHDLSGVPFVVVARRTDCDDVLVATTDPSKPLAVVHLTWNGRAEPDPHWPHTTLYNGWRDWIERCMIPDHQVFTRAG